MTSRLLSLRFEPHLTNATANTAAAIRKLVVEAEVGAGAGVGLGPEGETSMPLLNQSRRSIVYLSRGANHSRSVVNEAELLAALQTHVNPAFDLFVVGHTVEYKSIDLLHASWQHFAKLFCTAKVVIGPHGGAFNNLVWTPEDVHLIEFNEFPDDPIQSDSPNHNRRPAQPKPFDPAMFIGAAAATGPPVHSRSQVRPVFLNAAWAKGVEKFWIVNASEIFKNDFYESPMIISVAEVFRVLQRIGGGVLKEGFEIDKLTAS